MHFSFVAVGPQLVESFDLLFAHGCIVDFQNIDGIFFFAPVFIHSDDGLCFGIDAGLSACSGFFDTHFGNTCLDGFGHTAQFFYFLNQCPGFLGQFFGQGFYIVRTRPRIHLFADIGFFLNVNLGITGNAGRKVCRQGNGFVQSIGMQRLGMSQHCCHSLNTGASHVVEGILFGKRPTGGLGVGTQSHRLGILRIKLLNNFGPKHTGCPHFGDFHKMVHANGPKERKAGSEAVDVHSGIYSGSEVFQSVGQGVGQFNIGSGTCFLHMIAGNRNGIEFGHVLGGVLKDVGNYFHREFRRIDVGVANHKFLEDIVLDGAGHLFQFGSLFQPGVDVKSHNGQNGTVHGHGNRHFIQRNPVEKYFHIF